MKVFPGIPMPDDGDRAGGDSDGNMGSFLKFLFLFWLIAVEYLFVDNTGKLSKQERPA